MPGIEISTDSAIYSWVTQKLRHVKVYLCVVCKKKTQQKNSTAEIQRWVKYIYIYLLSSHGRSNIHNIKRKPVSNIFQWKDRVHSSYLLYLLFKASWIAHKTQPFAAKLALPWDLLSKRVSLTISSHSCLWICCVQMCINSIQPAWILHNVGMKFMKLTNMLRKLKFMWCPCEQNLQASPPLVLDCNINHTIKSY